ncbi:MAG: TIGR01777 family oxidoreductase [Candidatus Polarisedimenticolia bacterium]
MQPSVPGRLVVSGSTGLVGTALAEALGPGSILGLSRSRRPGRDAALWDPARGFIETGRLEGCQGVVHLAGESIAARRWTPAVKQSIRASRVEGTGLLVSALRGLSRPPRVLVSASAIGFYGDRGDEPLEESSPPGSGFLPDVAVAWEAEAARAGEAGIRVVCLRFGIILAARGGALAKMLPPFRLGLGGRLGSGRQWMSWVHVLDVVGAIRLALARDDLSGPVNVVAPAPVRNADFARALGRALGRPAVLPAPALALRAVLGEMADALLLSGQKVLPARLTGAGYLFRHPDLDGALNDLVG